MTLSPMIAIAIKQLMKGVTVRFDAEAGELCVIRNGVEDRYAFSKIEEMVNSGKIDL